MASPAPFFVLSRVSPEASTSGFSTTPTTVGHGLLPDLGRPAGSKLLLRLLARFGTLPSGTATVRVHSGSASGPILASVTTGSVGALVGATAEITAPATTESLFVVCVSSGGSCAISFFAIHITGDGEAALQPFSAAALPAEDDVDFGVDYDCLDNFPKSFVLASGFKNLGNALARRLLTPAGFLFQAFGGDPDYGYDLRGMLNRAQTLDQIAAIEAGVKAQVELDDRVLAAEVQASFDLASSTLSVEIGVETAQGPFALVLHVSQVTAELVLQPAA